MEMDHHHHDSLKSSSMVYSHRQSSIELEPRTLNIKQIDVAREAALYVVNTTSDQEALRIFTKGLAPVETCAGNDSGRLMNIGADYDDDWEDYKDNDATMRDIVSAPF